MRILQGMHKVLNEQLLSLLFQTEAPERIRVGNIKNTLKTQKPILSAPTLPHSFIPAPLHIHFNPRSSQISLSLCHAKPEHWQHRFQLPSSSFKSNFQRLITQLK